MVYLPCSYNNHTLISWGDPEGRTGGLDPPPLEKSQKYRLYGQHWSGSPKMTKLPSQHSMSGHHWHISETPFRCADDGLLIVFFRCSHKKLYTI